MTTSSTNIIFFIRAVNSVRFSKVVLAWKSKPWKSKAPSVLRQATSLDFPRLFLRGNQNHGIIRAQGVVGQMKSLMWPWLVLHTSQYHGKARLRGRTGRQRPSDFHGLPFTQINTMENRLVLVPGSTRRQ